MKISSSVSTSPLTICNCTALHSDALSHNATCEQSREVALSSLSVVLLESSSVPSGLTIANRRIETRCSRRPEPRSVPKLTSWTPILKISCSPIGLSTSSSTMQTNTFSTFTTPDSSTEECTASSSRATIRWLNCTAFSRLSRQFESSSSSGCDFRKRFCLSTNNAVESRLLTARARPRIGADSPFNTFAVFFAPPPARPTTALTTRRLPKRAARSLATAAFTPPDSRYSTCASVRKVIILCRGIPSSISSISVDIPIFSLGGQSLLRRSARSAIRHSGGGGAERKCLTYKGI
mmetsp:Transcript_2070/g.8075  ORF Transcript_2070/g.8075 Transcript_2070/m.8075 type:complete len:293 (+) Transcript_2070:11230-12108(+)